LSEAPPPIELNADDFTRVWNLAIAIYDGDDEDADLRDSFVTALKVYREFTTDLAEGGTTFDDESWRWTSELTRGQDGERLRFRPVPKPPPGGKKGPPSP
jgi:hypothetical protein